MPVAYNFNYHPGSLVLQGNDTVLGLNLYKWIGPALLIPPGAGGNSLNCFRVLGPSKLRGFLQDRVNITDTIILFGKHLDYGGQFWINFILKLNFLLKEERKVQTHA